jgi:hypothetical protein
MNFDMNTCWSRGVELLQSNFSLLIVIAGVFLMLPTIAIYLLIPDLQMLSDPSLDQSVVQERLAEIVGPIVGVALISSLFQFVGQSAMIALMGEARPTVGQALAGGFKVLPGLVVVMLVFVTVFFVGAMLITLPITLLAGVSGVPALGIVAMFPMLLFAVWLMARLSMTMPAMVLSGMRNPFTAIGESVRLTKPRQWPILLFWGMIYAIMTVIGLLFNGVIGVVASLFGTGTGAMLVVGLSNGVTGAITGMIVCALAVAMYAQLSGPGDAAIERTFD